MKIAVVGCGAMGCIYAGLLSEAGHEVWAVDRWVEHIDAIRTYGLRLEGVSGDRTIPLNATTTPSDVGPCDLVILATKAMHVAAAAKGVSPLLGEGAHVISIQNGLGGPDKAAEALGAAPIVIGVAEGFGASVRGPGLAHHNGMELIRLGNRGSPVTPALEEIADVWRHAGFNVRTFDDIDQLVWEKLICNVCYSGICTITERTVGEVMEDPDAWTVASGCATEAFNVAKAKHIAVDIDDPVAYVRSFGEKIPNATPSMLLDLLAGRASEIDVINGAIPREGRGVGVATPYNDVVSALVRAKERRMGVR